MITHTVTRTVARGIFANRSKVLPPVRSKLLLTLRPYAYGEDVILDDIYGNLGEDVVVEWRERYGEDVPIVGYMIPEDMQTEMFAILGNGLWFDSNGIAKQVNNIELAQSPEINQWAVWYRLDYAAGTGKREVFFYDPATLTEDDVTKIAAWCKEDPELYFKPSAFFNGLDFRLATYTGGPTYVPDHLGVLRSPGENKPACKGFPLDGTTYLTTDESGNPIVASTPQKTVTYSTDWTSKTFAETFDKFDISDPLKAPGWLCEPVMTNKCTCRKANPVDTSGLAASTINVTISVVSDPDILSSIYRDQCNTGKVYKAVWTGAAYIEISGAVANVNKHSSSIVAKVSNIIGSAVQFGLGNSTPKTTIVGAEYSKYLQENVTPYDSVTKLVLYKPDGTGECYFILPQLEGGAFCTSPICKASDGTDPLTSLVRAATIPSFPTAGKIPVNDFAIRMIVVPRASGQSGVYLFGSYVDANNSFSVSITSTAIALRKRISGVNTDATVTLTPSSGVPIDIALVSTAAGGMQISARTFSSAWGSFTNGTVNSASAAKANAQIGSTYQLGALNGGSQFTGNISLFDCVPIPAGTTDPMAWAKTHWGVA